LPRTFQLGGLRQSDWHLALERRQPLELGASHERAGPLPSANPAARSAEGRPVTAPRGEFDLELPGQGSVTRWTLRLAAVTMLVGGLVLIFLLVQATNNRLLYERYFTRLLWVNIAAAVVLALVILWGVYRLLSRLRRGKFGSRLLIKLAAIFGLVGVLPGLLIYGVSYQFVSRSIESWFDVKVEGALESGLTLARSSLETQARIRQPAARRRGPAGRHARRGGGPLERLRTQIGATDANLWSSSGRLIASAGCRASTFRPALGAAAAQRAPRAWPPRSKAWTKPRCRARPAARPRRASAPWRWWARARWACRRGRLVEAVQPLPSVLVETPWPCRRPTGIPGARAGPPGLAPHVHRHPDAGAVPGRVRRGAAGGAAGQPAGHALLMLADGVRQVAAGDLRPKVSAGRDELAGLTRSFADMTRQLADARAAVDASMREVDAARQPADHPGQPDGGRHRARPGRRIQSANPGATRILRALGGLRRPPLAALPGWRPSATTCRRSSTSSRPLASSMGSTTGSTPSSCTAPPTGPTPRPCRWWRAARPAGRAAPAGVRRHLRDRLAQRTQAWGEVARRLAHEIKNPLTPIQLSAERLEHSWPTSCPNRPALLIKSVHTIVDQVDAMKRLVNEFRDYAPARGQLKPWT
jgi:hypothetical protein